VTTTMQLVKQLQPTTMPCASIRWVQELYPRLKPDDEAIERYRLALDRLPPIVVARDGVLVDGYHRWQAHKREGKETVEVENLGNLADAEIIRESIKRNATHGQQLSCKDKKALAVKLWAALADLKIDERVKDIAELLAVTDQAVRNWTTDVRKAEQEELQAKAWRLHLDCLSDVQIGKALDCNDKTAKKLYSDFSKTFDFSEPPGATKEKPWGNIEHFDIWHFPPPQNRYFGAQPPQLMENILWYFTKPGDIIVDLVAGSGTTIDVAKAMGRRVWASDIRGNHYSPHLPIHRHDATTGWPADAPNRADLIFLDPPYWKQAAGRYSNEPNELAEMDLDAFMSAWAAIVKIVTARAHRVAYLIMPTTNKGEVAVDHATMMLPPFIDLGWRVERRIIAAYSTEIATGSQVDWARANRRILGRYRDLVVMCKEKDVALTNKRPEANGAAKA
jgi:hypothetical protein